jgi:hypothetical protein
MTTQTIQEKIDTLARALADARTEQFYTETKNELLAALKGRLNGGQEVAVATASAVTIPKRKVGRPKTQRADVPESNGGTRSEEGEKIRKRIISILKSQPNGMLALDLSAKMRKAGLDRSKWFYHLHSLRTEKVVGMKGQRRQAQYFLK